MNCAYAPPKMGESSVPEIEAEVRELVEERAGLQLTEPEVERSNVIHVEAHRLAKKLRDTEEGRSAMEAFLGHPYPSVRVWAAAYVLFWNEPSARQALEAVRDEVGALNGFEARMVLQEFDAGRLDMSW